MMATAMRRASLGCFIAATTIVAVHAQVPKPSPVDVARCRAIVDLKRQFACFATLNAKLKRLAAPTAAPAAPSPQSTPSPRTATQAQQTAPPEPNLAESAPTNSTGDETSETLLPLTYASFPSDLKRALSKVSVHEPIKTIMCLEGATDKPKICNYSVGDFLYLMAATDKGASDISVITLICNVKNDADSAKCLLSYAAAMELAGGSASTEDKGKILGILMEGLNVGNEMTIVTDDRKFVMQKSMGLWLHIIAAASQQAQ